MQQGRSFAHNHIPKEAHIIYHANIKTPQGNPVMLTTRARNSRQAAAQIRRSTARFAVDLSPAESRAIVSMERPVVLDTGHILSVRAYR